MIGVSRSWNLKNNRPEEE